MRHPFLLGYEAASERSPSWNFSWWKLSTLYASLSSKIFLQLPRRSFRKGPDSQLSRTVNPRLDAAQNEEIDRGYARIREVGERTIIPGIPIQAWQWPLRCGCHSDGDQFHVYTCGLGESLEVARIGCEDIVSVGRQTDDRGVDDVRTATGGKQQAGAATQRAIEVRHLDGRQQHRDRGLFAPTTAPYLPYHAAVGNRRATGLALSFDERHHIAVTALDRDERARV
jgi:hypothetical protein